VIDRGNDQEWPAELRKHLAQFRQGSVVSEPPVAYYANTNRPLWAASRDSAEPADEELIELAGEAQPPYGMIVTQDCDIEGQGADKKPWVQVVPVYQLSAVDAKLTDIRRWAIRHLAPVTALGHEWIADLRIESPLEKSWLITQSHRAGFETAEEYARFSAHARAYRGRPGLADAVYIQVLEPLHLYILSLRTANRALYDEFADTTVRAYASIAGDPLNPETLQIVLVGRDDYSQALIESLNSWWESVGELEFVLLSNRYLTLSSQVTLLEQQLWTELDHRRLYAS
jgi:hypothetical protein